MASISLVTRIAGSSRHGAPQCCSSRSPPGIDLLRSAWTSRPFAGRTSLRCTAGKGFGAGSGEKQKASKPPRLVRPGFVEIQELQGGSGAAPTKLGPEWLEVAKIDVLDTTKEVSSKAVILDTKRAIMLYKVGDRVYCSDANSTAYQFPLIDAKILQRDGGPVIEVPLDGTTYDLGTGKVLEWCPKNNLIRTVLGTLKGATTPTPLAVYPAVCREGTIYVKFVKD